ncbi:uncharacterized protein LOC143729596 [Siphateles boraxobius]|uniref:uncharacterized protein LOC143729596 n=1 Tax=Siphateles boraxobius TaxID=180520 RepID=UPI00406366DB
MATERSTGGSPVYPRAAASSRGGKADETSERSREDRGVFQDFEISSCTSGKKGIGVCRGRGSAALPKNQSSSRERSGQGGGLHSSPMLAAARESMAVISGSDSSTAVCTPEGGSCDEPSLPEESNPPSDAATDMASSSVASTEARGPPEGRPAGISSSLAGTVIEEGGWGRGHIVGALFQTVTLRSPWPPAAGRGVDEGTLTLASSRSLDRNDAMVMFPQREHESSTSAALA